MKHDNSNKYVVQSWLESFLSIYKCHICVYIYMCLRYIILECLTPRVHIAQLGTIICCYFDTAHVCIYSTVKDMLLYGKLAESRGILRG